MNFTVSPLLRDSAGKFIGIGDTVSVPDPNETDGYDHAFTGTVYGFHSDWVTVLDSDELCWDIEPERLTIEND